jgi:Mn2+/Fe2+ NRAMP family transporter
MEKVKTQKSILKTLGPGMLYAGAAIGVSHLVQSTRAGADFGYTLVWAVLIANILKYPFFEFGPRYAAATGKTLLHGYRKLGKRAIVLFVVLTISTMFVIQAAVTLVTAGLASELTGLHLELWQWCVIILGICSAIILIGRYAVLDKAIKVIIILLTVSTIAAFLFAFTSDTVKPGPFASFTFSSKEHFMFLIALIGWMPAPLDISVWHSVWSVQKNRGVHGKETLRTSLFDFKLGYWGTAVLALLFLGLGAMMMYGTGQEIPTSGGAFAKKLIEVYTASLGGWAYWLIGIAAITTMFSTTLTCLDAFPRVLGPATQMLRTKSEEEPAPPSRQLNQMWLGITVVGAVVVVTLFKSRMLDLIDTVTVLSFVAAPVFAILNYSVIFGKDFPLEYRPSTFIKVLSWVGILFLVGFSAYFLILKFML